MLSMGVSAVTLVYMSAVIGLVGSLDVGFELLFSTSKRSYLDHEIYFEKPIPQWVRGNYIRNGLGRFEMGHRNFTHAFDAFAKLASWKITGKRKVLFTTKFIRTNAYKDSRKSGDIAPYLLFDSTEPKFNFFQQMESLYHGIDNTNVNVFKFGQTEADSSYLAVSDFWQAYQFDPRTLRTRRQINAKLPAGHFYNKPFPLPSSSHPVQEYGTTNYINFLCILNPFAIIKSSINIIRIRDAERRDLIASIPVDNVPYMHSFGLSKNYATIFADPLYVNTFKMLKTVQAVKSLDWKPEEMSTIYLIDIRTGRYVSFSTEAVFHMHHINSFEVGGKLHVDFVTYPDIEFLTSLELHSLRDRVKRNDVDANCFLRRYTFDLLSNTVTHHDFAPTLGNKAVHALDMPVINTDYQHQPYCYVYGLVTKSDGVNLANTTLARKNLCRDNADLSWYEENHYPSEPWFIPNPQGTAEDDGILLSVVLDGVAGKSYLAMFDPRTMHKINTAYMPTHIPFSLHGRLFSDDEDSYLKY